jgi:hypothetical protein
VNLDRRGGDKNHAHHLADRAIGRVVLRPFSRCRSLLWLIMSVEGMFVTMSTVAGVRMCDMQIGSGARPAKHSVIGCAEATVQPHAAQNLDAIGQQDGEEGNPAGKTHNKRHELAIPVFRPDQSCEVRLC